MLLRFAVKTDGTKEPVLGKRRLDFLLPPILSEKSSWTPVPLLPGAWGFPNLSFPVSQQCLLPCPSRGSWDWVWVWLWGESGPDFVCLRGPPGGRCLGPTLAAPHALGRCSDLAHLLPTPHPGTQPTLARRLRSLGCRCPPWAGTGHWEERLNFSSPASGSLWVWLLVGGDLAAGGRGIWGLCSPPSISGPGGTPLNST